MLWLKPFAWVKNKPEIMLVQFNTVCNYSMQKKKKISFTKYPVWFWKCYAKVSVEGLSEISGQLQVV